MFLNPHHEKMIYQYSRNLKKVLVTFDPDKFRAFIEKYSYLFPRNYTYVLIKKEDWFIKGVMAKMVMNSSNLKKEDYIHAQQILASLDWDSDINYFGGFEK